MRALHVAYADPPYPRCAKKHYRSREVDHARLIAHLAEHYPDGWALSTSAAALQYVLSLCPAAVRVAAWVKPFAVFKPFVNPAYCWEPVIFTGGRRPIAGRKAPTARDWLSCPASNRTGLAGSKPDAFCFWLFELLGLSPIDTLDDLFPGTGAVGRCFARFVAGETLTQPKGTDHAHPIATKPGHARRASTARRPRNPARP